MDRLVRARVLVAEATALGLTITIRRRYVDNQSAER
jgi:hypothetical protein